MSSATITLLILMVAAVLFITEVIPLAITAIGVSFMLFLTGVIDAKTAFSGLSDSNVILIAAMFPVGAALFETGVAAKIGQYITKFASTEKRAIVAIMIVGATLSAFLSNTGTTAVMMPIVIGIAASAGYSRSKSLMTLIFAVALGGTISLIGTPTNLVVHGVLKQAGLQPFGFFELAKIGIPATIIGTIYMVTIGYKIIPDRGIPNTFDSSSLNTQSAATAQNVSSRNQIISVVVIIGTILVMIFEKKLGVPMHIAAVIGSTVLVISKVMTEKQAYKSIDMTTVFLLACMMPMGTAMAKSGAAKMIADTVVGAVGKEGGPYLLMAALFLLVAILTQFMSNTATATLIAPIGLAIASSMGADPRALLAGIAIAASSSFASPVASPPNSMILGAGNFKFMDYVKAGVPLLLILCVICTFLVPIIWPFY